jgi:hypothetical protein
MSNDKQQPHHRPQSSGPLADVKGIAIRHLHFRETVDIPGRLSSQGVVADDEVSNRKRWRITYLPALRSFQLDFYAPNQSAPDSTFFVGEHLAMWWMPA